MPNIGLNTNNPGNLTVNGPGSFLYPGQTGVYSSGNGFNYASFGTPQAGSNALIGWLQNNLGTNPQTSLSNVGDTLGYYLNSGFNGVQNTPANPNAVGYAAGVASSLGMGLSDNFTATQLQDPNFLNQLGAAISKQEGTSSVFSPGSVSPTSGGTNTVAQYGSDAWYLNNIPNAAQTFLNNALGMFGIASGAQGQVSQNTAGGAIGSGGQPSAAQGGTGGGLFQPLIDWFNGLIKGFDSGVGGFLERGGFIIVGLILIAAGLLYLAVSNKTVQQVVAVA